MEQDQRAIHKLIILAILGQASGLTYNQLMTLALETLYLDYFAFVSSSEELIRDHLVTEAVRKGELLMDAAGQPLSRCDITPHGRNILATLETQIPLPIRSYLASALRGWRKDQLRENTVTATADPDGNGFYRVHLRQHDGRKETVELVFSVPNKVIADAICANWLQYPKTMYLGILSLLTEPDGRVGFGHEKRQEPLLPEGLFPSDQNSAPVFEDRQLNLPIK